MSDASEWRLLDTRTRYRTGWYDGGFDLVRQPDGSRKRYYWAALPPAVVVVPIVDDEIVFVEQYRPAIRRHCLELPAGIVEYSPDAAGEPDPVGDERGRESYATAAARELREETGFTTEQTHTLETFWCATGVLRHRRGVVVAKGLERGSQSMDDNEFLEVTTLPRDTAIATARERPVNDATLEALLLAKADGFL